MLEPRRIANVARLPWQDGDGYSYGGNTILIIGDIAVDLGTGSHAADLAAEIARRWNAEEEAPRDGQ